MVGKEFIPDVVTPDTLKAVVVKCIGMAVILYGYQDTPRASIVYAFSSNPLSETAVLKDCIKAVESLLQARGLNFDIRIIAEDAFAALVLDPICNCFGYDSPEAEDLWRVFWEKHGRTFQSFG